MGRPMLTSKQKQNKKLQLLQKIEPFLKAGLSTNKALFEAKIHNSEFYRYMEEDSEFRDRIEQFRNFTTILLSNTFFKELLEIVNKQRNGTELNSEDRKFLWKFIKGHKQTREEYGRRNKLENVQREIEIMKNNLQSIRLKY